MEIIKQYFYMLKTSWRFSNEKRWQMLLFYPLFIVANILYMMRPYVIGQFINSLQIGDNLLDNTVYYMSIYALLSLMFWVFHGPARVIENSLAFHIKKNANMFYYSILGEMPLSWHHEHHSGNTINRINKSTLSLHDFSTHQFVYIEMLIRVVVAFIMLAIVNIYIMLAAFVLSTIVIIFMLKLDKIIIRQVFLANEKEHVFSAKFFDYIANMLNIIGFNLQGLTRYNLIKRLDTIYPHMRKKYVINEWKWCGKMLMVAAGVFMILYGYISYHESNNIPVMVGTIVIILQYLERIEAMLSKMAEMFNKLATQYTDYTSVKPIQEDYLVYKNESEKETKELVATEGKIRFNNISFNYHGNLAVFKGLNLDIEPHEKVGLVGVSGAGKTTLINLLLRSHNINGGSICIDGQDICKSTSDSVISNIALIPQDISLFEEDVLENIRYGRIAASDEEVIDAAKKAYADIFINELPNKYKTLVGERGIHLSGGQRQRIAIARAILKNTPILILDEATSALDSESEEVIQKSLHSIMENKTVIAVAHRLSTIAHMDRIVVMDKGCIIEMGNHADLLKQKGTYYKLWKKQSAKFF